MAYMDSKRECLEEKGYDNRRRMLSEASDGSGIFATK